MTLFPIAIVLGLLGQGAGMPDASMQKTFVDLMKSGILVGYRDGLGSFREPTLHDYAVAVHASLSHLDQLMADPEAQKELAQADVQRFLIDGYWNLRRLELQLRPELDVLQARKSAEVLISRISDRFGRLGIDLENFRDVPNDHWAAVAVKDLKDEGLLRGYPNGSFRRS